MPTLEALPSIETVTAEWLAPNRRRVFQPAPRITLSEWSDKHRILSRVASAEPGRWMTARAPYQRAIMDAISDPTIRDVVLMKSSQVGFTEMLCNAVGYYIDQDPAPILMVQPTLDMGKAWSTDRLAPMLRESPQLRGKVRESNRRHSGDTLFHKVFPGGHLTVTGANSASGLASRPIRVALFDEVDRYPESAGNEGDPVSLGYRRTVTFHNAKRVLGSTPTLKGLSRIEEAYGQSDQRKFFVPCPDCETMQLLEWPNLRWEDGKPETAAYVCPDCGGLIGEDRKGWMLERGEWVAQNPGAPSVGFHINALYSPWARWGDLAREWLECQGNLTRLQVFVNTILGETWEERGGGLDPNSLKARQEAYEGCPTWTRMVTMGVDVQDGWLEYEIRAWGPGEESALVRSAQIMGDPGMSAVWAELDTVRRQTIGGHRVTACCVDSGYHTDAVYKYCKARLGEHVFAVKGSSTPGRSFLPKRPSRNNKGGVRLYELGTEAAKDLIYSRLKLQIPGPGYVHIPTWTPESWYDQITAERPVRKLVAGRWHRRYELREGRRSEALDVFVYSLAALRIVAPWLLMSSGTVAKPEPEPEPDPPSVEVPPIMQPPTPPKRRTPLIVGRIRFQ